MFHTLLAEMKEVSQIDFFEAVNQICNFIDRSSDLTALIREIGIIPESMEHDSTQEKLFSKASDAILARAFRELGLKSTILKERGDSADVQAESVFHGYTLVADAKAFRLSRTAKNQKDFKVVALSGWRKDSDYAVLCSPYFQYPVRTSQIYAQAVDHNVCLLSWEHLLFLIQQGVSESETVNLSELWNFSGKYAQTCVVAEKKNCFIPLVDQTVIHLASASGNDFQRFLKRCENDISQRAVKEISFWNHKKAEISSYTREQAISELIKTRKIDEKIAQIRKYI